VEVETHLHSVSNHIEPQLRDLASGFYGPEAFAYLERHAAFDRERYEIDEYEPDFLLVIDALTPEVREAAARTNFSVVECSVFRSSENRYALCVSGARPRASRPPVAGLEVRVEEAGGVAILVPADGKGIPPLRQSEVVVAGMVYNAFALASRRGLALPLTPEDLYAETGTTRFTLTPTGTLIPLPTQP
jgi:hypothetical protein